MLSAMIMSGFGVLLLIILISAIPVIAVYCWFRVSHYPFPLLRFLLVLLAGAAAFFPALVMQYFFPSLSASGRWALLFRIFSRVAFTEELSRLIILAALLWISRRFDARNNAADPARSTGLSYSDVSRGSAAGLVAGLGFAVLESAYYGAASVNVTLLRTFTAAPLHAACGSRVGGAAVMCKNYTAQAVFRFLSAVIIHGIYNFFIITPGFPAVAAVLIALFALASSILAIHSGKEK